jgi:hypothetical protein
MTTEATRPAGEPQLTLPAPDSAITKAALARNEAIIARLNV